MFIQFEFYERLAKIKNNKKRKSLQIYLFFIVNLSITFITTFKEKARKNERSKILGDQTTVEIL